MLDELTELLDTAIYKEIAANAFYRAGQSKSADPGARTLMRELADEELKHSQWLKEFKEKGASKSSWQAEKIADLMIGEYLTGGDTVEGAGLQDTLTFAIKREKQAMDFYSRMMGVIRDESARRVCQRLVHEETRHKLRLEKLYEDMFYKEN
ncbi:MAG: ferritin family protein [Chloroflexi bacterium]|nr:ferritin family protein [Chloroflexota bacterium]